MKNLIAIVWLFYGLKTLALPTNDLWIAGAELLQKGHLRIDMQQDYALNSKPAASTSSLGSLGLALGIWQRSHWSMEAGLDAHQAPLASDAFRLHTKLVYNPSSPSFWRVAIGLRDYSPQASMNLQQVYMVSDIHISSQKLLRVGIYQGADDALRTSAGAASAEGLLFAYYQSVYRETGRLAIEWVSGQSMIAALYLGAHLRFSEAVNVMLAYRQPNDLGFAPGLLFRINLFY